MLLVQQGATPHKVCTSIMETKRAASREKLSSNSQSSTRSPYCYPGGQSGENKRFPSNSRGSASVGEFCNNSCFPLRGTYCCPRGNLGCGSCPRFGRKCVGPTERSTTATATLPWMLFSASVANLWATVNLVKVSNASKLWKLF